MSRLRDAYNALIGGNRGERDKQLEAEKKSLMSSLEGVVNEQLYSLSLAGSSTSVTNPYNNNYVVNRASNLIANAIAELPLRIYRGQDPMEAGFMLPGLFNLELPNPNLPLSEIMYRCILYYINKGAFFVEIEEDPKIIWTPRNPSNMKQQSNGTWTYQSKNERKTILPENLIHLTYFNPNDDTYNDSGLSPVKVVEQEIYNDNKAREYNSKYFENFGRIGVLLKNVAGLASEEQMKKIVDQFNAVHAGSSRAWKALGLPDGIDYTEFSQNMRDMEFAQGRVDNRDRILAILGTHKALLGATDSVDRASAKEAMRQLYINTVKPLALRIQQVINLQFFRPRPKFAAYTCKYDFSEVEELKESQTEKLERAKILRDLGYTMNEINTMMDLKMDEVTDPVGDTRFIPNNLIPASDLFIDIQPTKSIKLDKNITKIVELLEEDEQKAENKTTRASYLRNWHKLHRSSNRKIKSKMGNYFSLQLAKILNIINSNGKSVSKDINQVLIMSEIKRLLTDEGPVLVEMLKPVYQDISKDSSGLALRTLGSSVPARIKDDIVNNMVNKVTTINDSVYKLVLNELKESVAAGETIKQLSERIRKVGKFNSGYAATRIARTESTKIISACTHDEYKNNGVERKIWLNAGDGNVRDEHVANSEQGAIPIDQAFISGEMYPGENSINCRCAIAPQVG